MSELKPLPDPFDYCYEWDSPFGTVRKFSQAPHNGQGPDRSVTLFTADQMHAYALENRRAQPAAPADAEPSVAPEPVAWTLQSELDAAQTTCSAHLWFTNPRNSAWTALFTREQIAAHPPRAPLTEAHVTAVVRSVCPNLAETSKAWRDLVVECRYWLEAAHGIGGK